MALRFPWATKEYLLWNMTIGQVMMYWQYATETAETNGGGTRTVKDMSASEIRTLREELRQQYGEIGDG